MSEGYQLAVRAFSVLMITSGVAMVAITLSNGGGVSAVGILFGVLFAAIGAGRLYISMRR